MLGIERRDRAVSVSDPQAQRCRRAGSGEILGRRVCFPMAWVLREIAAGNRLWSGLARPRVRAALGPPISTRLPC